MKIASFSAALLLGLVSADDAEMTGRQLQATTSAHYVECGKVGRCRSETGYLAPNNEVHEIRCCSNAPPTGFSGRWDVRAPRTALTPGFTCPWTESPQWNDVDCPTGTYEEAEDICAQVSGARLCTLEEALNDCLKGTGCGFDNDLIWTSTTAPPPPTGSPTPSPVDDDKVNLIVKYKNENGANKAKGLAKDGLKEISSRNNLTALRVSRQEMKDLKDDPDIEYVEIDYEVFALPHMRGSDAEISSTGERRLAEDTPWGITRVKAGLDGLAQGSAKKVKVCVVDTGYDNDHPDLPDLNPLSDGFTPPTYDGVWNVDGHGHGTHCAGTIGAIGGNNEGVDSVNPDPSLMDFFIGKGLTDTGSGSTSGVLQAVEACKDNGADIISMSLGGGPWTQASFDTYTNMYDAGVLIIAAAGNGGSAALSYPASYPQVMSVAATDSNDNKAGFSQWNDQVEIAAPGVGVMSTLPGGQYAAWSGTSMATPHVAGVAALVWSHFPDCNNNHIRNALIQSAEDFGDQGCDVEFGFGVVNAQAAYDYLDANPCQGGDYPGDASSYAVGGCEQDPTFTKPPTPAPTPCGGTTAKLEIQTDSWGSETSWRVLDDAGSEISEGGGSYASNTLHEENICLSEGDYFLEISDSWGDGIFSPGYYKLFLGDTQQPFKHGGGSSPDGNFAFTETTFFTIDPIPPSPVPPTPAPVVPTPAPVPPTAAPVVPPTPAPVTPTAAPVVPPTPAPVTPTAAPVVPPTPAPVTPTAAPVVPPTPAPVTPTAAPVVPPTPAPVTPTAAPVVPPTPAPVTPTAAPVVPPTPAPVTPTAAPVVPPTPAPVTPTAAPVNPCPVVVTVEIITDEFPYETTWTVTDSMGELKGSGGPYGASGTNETTQVCVDDENVSFNIADSYGDGICCGYGDGSYKVSVGTKVIDANGQFAYGQSSFFGPAYGATSVVASVKRASGETCKGHSDCLTAVCLGSGHCE